VIVNQQLGGRTPRRMFRRNPDNSVNLNFPSITLDVHGVELVRSDEQVRP
jgi:hypothetical protein